MAHQLYGNNWTPMRDPWNVAAHFRATTTATPNHQTTMAGVSWNGYPLGATIWVWLNGEQMTSVGLFLGLGWALEAHSRSLSWRKRIRHHWSLSWKEEIANCMMFHSMLSKSCIVHWCFFCISLWYGGTEAACQRAVRTFLQMVLVPMMRLGCAAGICRLLMVMLNCWADVV